MEEFKTDSDFRPDSSDRPTRASRPSYGSSSFYRWSLPVSRQHLMIGVGILVLLLLILAIGSVLNGPAQRQATSASLPISKEVNLSSAMQPEQQIAPPPLSEGGQPVPTGTGGVQELHAPPVASTPTEAPSAPHDQQRRIELPGDLSSALTQQQQAISEVAQEKVTGLPTAPATLSGTPERAAEKKVNQPVSQPANKLQAEKVIKPGQRATPPGSAVSSGGAGLHSLPANHFTLQLSGASRPDTLKAFANKHQLTHYWVYETRRNGKAWYVLISGDYASSAEAKRAIASLPAEVQALKPWAKPVKQVLREVQ